MKVVVVTEKGTDFFSRDGKYDGHARFELVGEERKLVVDVFDYQIRDDGRAHVDSQEFDPNLRGFKEATDWLNSKFNFDVTLAGVGVERR